MGLPRSGHDSVLRFEPEVLSGSYRVLWIGAPEFLGVEGRPLDDGLAWATTSGDEPTIADRAVTADPGRADLIEARAGRHRRGAHHPRRSPSRRPGRALYGAAPSARTGAVQPGARGFGRWPTTGRALSAGSSICSWCRGSTAP